MSKHRQAPYTVILCVLASMAMSILAISATAPPASGHAVPAQYSIPPNQEFRDKNDVPQKLTISYSERPDPKVSYIRISDSEGKRIDKNDFSVVSQNGREAAVTIDISMIHNGIYTVSWFTMSLDDGHITEGAYVFGVDIAISQTQSPSQMRYVTSTEDALFKWPLLVAQSAIVGAALAHIVFHKRIGASALPLRRFSIVLFASSGALLASATAILFLQAYNLSVSAGVPLEQALASLFASTPTGTVWAIRFAMAAIVIGSICLYVIKKGHSNFPLYIALAASSISLFSNSMLSHNSAAPFLPELATALDWTHFMAVSIWIGGLFYLATVFAPATRNSPRQLASAIPAFSLMATVSLGVIGVTGIYMAWVHLHTLDSLFSTDYGASLVVKLTSALPMVLLGAYHQLKLHRQLVVAAKTSSNQQQAQVYTLRFGKTIKAEALIGIGVLLAASFLTITSPPMEQEASMGQASQNYLQKINVDGTDVSLGISPFQPGVNTFTVMLLENGKAPQNIASVVLRLNVNATTGPLIVTLQKDSANDGVYSTTGAYLSQAGEWKIDLIAQRINAYDLNHGFVANLDGKSSSLGTGMVMPEMENNRGMMSPHFDFFAALAIVLASVVAGGSAFYARQSRIQMKRTVSALG